MNLASRLYLYGGLLLAIALLAAGALLWLHHYGDGRYAAGVQDGRNAVLASDARAAQQLQAQRTALDKFGALATSALNQQLGTTLPAIEGQTHATVETIRTIYRDRPAGDLCARPAGVQQQLDQAVDRANAAITAPSRQL